MARNPTDARALSPIRATWERQRSGVTRSAIAVIAAVALAVVAPGCDDQPQTNATIRGVVVHSACSAETTASPCLGDPYPGVEVHAAYQGDMVVASDTTDADGRFALAVQGGVKYRVFARVKPSETVRPVPVRVPVGDAALVVLYVER